MPVIDKGIDAAARILGDDEAALGQAAHAILTTDSHIKISTRTVELKSGAIRLTGFAKGAAMIGPNMATLLAFVLTDACVCTEDLAALAARRRHSPSTVSALKDIPAPMTLYYSWPTVKGSRSTVPIWRSFNDAATSVCADLARAIAADAEGANHLITIQVEGTRTDAEAHKIAKTVAESALVKTAIFGGDPNWGRIVSAAGYAGVMFEETDLSLWLGDFLLYDKGTPLPFDAATVSAFIKNNRELSMRLLFTLGSARCTFFTCDLTYEYVRLNADYTT